jgi:hypothetical protein
MPRRRALTDAQLENLIALPVIEADLIRHWALAAADLAMIERRGGGHNQLGYALQLCAFRYPGRLLRPGEAIPETATHFVANQLGVSANALAAYAARPQTRREQLDSLREGFGFLMYAHGHGREMLAWLLPVALATTNAVTVAAPLTRNLSSAQTEALDALLGSKEDASTSVLAWMRQPPGAPGQKALKRIVDQLARLRIIGPDPAIADGVHPERLRKLAPEGGPFYGPAPACSHRFVVGRLWSRLCWIPRRG